MAGAVAATGGAMDARMVLMYGVGAALGDVRDGSGSLNLSRYPDKLLLFRLRTETSSYVIRHLVQCRGSPQRAG